MSDQPPPRRRQGFWLTVGEIVAVLGLLLAALNYWETREQQHQQAKRTAAAERAAEALVVTGEASPDGRKVTIRAVNASEAIQSQRYYFPHAVAPHAMEVTAAQPQIDVGWIEGGLRHALDLKGEGEATVPVAIVTTYVEDGETRTDISVYRLGYAWQKGGIFGGVKLRLQGLALVKRHIRGDPRAAADAAWGASS